MFTVKKALKSVQAISGFLRPKGLILETILADFISKSSCLRVYSSVLIQSTNFSSSALPKSMLLVSKETIVSGTTSSFFSYFFFFSSFFSTAVSGVLSASTLTTLPVAIFLARGGFLMIYLARECLLSSSPTKGQESHLPLIFYPMTLICISGSLHLGQQMYFSMNLSSTLRRSSSLKSPLMMQLVLFLPPAYLKVVEEAFQKPKNLRMYCSLVRRSRATSPRLTMLVLIPLPLLSILTCILGMRQRYLGSTTVEGMFNICQYSNNIKERPSSIFKAFWYHNCLVMH